MISHRSGQGTNTQLMPEGGIGWERFGKIRFLPKFLPRMPNPSRENFGAPEGFDRFREEYDIRPEFRAKFLPNARH